MGTKYRFEGKIVKLAGIYSAIKSGVKNPPLDLDYGKIMIIDTGSGAGFGYGSGILGTLAKGADAIYAGLTDPGVMKAAVGGGLWWKLADALFKPDGDEPGASEVVMARAAETVPAEINYAFANAAIKLQCRNEGTVGNGVATGGVVTRGYAAIFSAGRVDPAKYMMSFVAGTYKGADSYNGSIPYDDIPEDQCVPELLVESPEVADHAELKAWMVSDTTLNSLFKVHTYTITAPGTIVAADVTAFAGVNKLAAGGTETYSSTALSKVLDYIAPLNFSLILLDQVGSEAAGTLNMKIHYHIKNEARFNKIMIIAGGNDEGSFAQATSSSVAAAKLYDDDSVVIVHGGIRKSSNKVPTGFKTYPALFKAAYVTGRLAGLPPQVPITFKGLDYDGEVHQLTKNEQEKAVDSGVLYTIWDDDLGRFTVAQGINSIQVNDFYINDDGTTHSIQIKRIAAQLNKEIVVNAKKQLFGNPNGVNRNTLSEQTVNDWLDEYLKARLAKPTKDNLLISYKDIVVERRQDAYFISYKFSPNGEITKMFFTGFMID